MPSKKLRAGILGATGMVGQTFVRLLSIHPWFEISELAASPQSRGKTYEDAVRGRWSSNQKIPPNIKKLRIKAVEEDIDEICQNVDIVFSAIDLDKERIRKIEERYASKNIPVISNNSAHRWTEDVPMIIPEINPEHAALIDIQRKNRGWKKGLIAVKPNCSIQSYVPVIKALEKYEPEYLNVTTLQAISGAGKTFESWPEMIDNVDPLIKGEEEKSEKEPMKILGKVTKERIEVATVPRISATCIRVPVTDGHMASISLKLNKKITKERFIDTLVHYKNPIADLKLPSAPKQFMKYFYEEDRPQTRLDRDYEKGMGIAIGRLRQESDFDWKFVSLSHNTIRGAAGGAVLVAELLHKRGYF